MYQIEKKSEMRIFVDQCNIFMHDGITCRKIKIDKNLFGEKTFVCWTGPEFDQI